jgi:beta-N-acetylhexosaminidase
MSDSNEQLRREIGQHFVVGFHGTEPSEDIKLLIREYYVGSVILFKRNLQDSMPEQVHKLIRDLQQIAKDAGHERPLMVGIDQENGLVSAFSTPKVGTQFPGAMGLAATGSTSLVEQVTAASAKEMKSLGINWVYSPVADINSEPKNPVIGVRSFGDDSAQVSRHVLAVKSSLESHRIAASAKHFPGHGDTHTDSHLSLPVILKSKSTLSNTELVPFRALVDAGIASIMTGHMALPNITGDDTPCSLSRTISHDLLRGEMGYGGVVVTDCLEMEAVAQIYGSEKGAVMSLQAGADIAMICHTLERQRGAVQLALDAALSGELSLDEMKESSKRIEILKDRFAGSWDDVLNSSFDSEVFEALKKEHAHLSVEAYGGTIALVQDLKQYLPLLTRSTTTGGGRVLLLTPVSQAINKAVDEVLLTDDGKVRNTAGAHYSSFASFLEERYCSELGHLVYSPQDAQGELRKEVQEAQERCDAVIFVTRNADRASWQVDLLKAVSRASQAQGTPKKIVVLSSCAPYDLIGVQGDGVEDVAYVACFDYTALALCAAAQVIFGERKATGRVPVLSGKVAPGQGVGV